MSIYFDSFDGIHPLGHSATHQIAPQATRLAEVSTLIADTDYCSENNVNVCEEAKVVPLIAVARQDHHLHWRERHTESPALIAAPRQCRRSLIAWQRWRAQQLAPFINKR